MGDRSSEGDRRAYEADDQRKYSNDELAEMKKKNEYFEGKENSHMPNDSKDQQTIANKLAKESKKEDDASRKNKDTETLLAEQDSTAPAKFHGNEPSKGAKIDQELREEEEEYIRKKKGEFGHRSGKNEPSGKGRS